MQLKKRKFTQLTVLSLALALSGTFLASASVTGESNSFLIPAHNISKPNYREFPHSVKAHQKECSSCHTFPSENWKSVRAKDAFPDVTDYPHHESCVGCHKQQFFKGSPPAICSICHTNPSPRDSSRHPFPNPREIFDQSKKGKTAQSDFVVAFSHEKHVDIVSENTPRAIQFEKAGFYRTSRVAEESCAVCHQTLNPQGKSDDEFITVPPKDNGDNFWLKKGTFKSAPIGHTKCFVCHNADTGILPEQKTCSACHQLKPPMPKNDFDEKLAAQMKVEDKVMLDSWRRRHSSGTFRHEWFSHDELACSTCHTVNSIKTENPLTTALGIEKCATCHATATADDGGALNYEMEQRKKDPKFQCIKCHVSFGKLPAPDSHQKALAKAAEKK